MNTVTLSVPVRRENVLHFLGYRGRKPLAQVEGVLGSVLDEARSLISPVGVSRTVTLDFLAALGLDAHPGARVATDARLGLGLVTVGAELERRVSNLLAHGESTRALLLDAAGSAAAEEAADELENRLHAGRTHRRFSPGYGSWPLTAQRALFEFLPHQDIGVELLSSCLMMPRKSVSFAVWLGSESETDLPQSRCRSCGRIGCPYREGNET